MHYSYLKPKAPTLKRGNPEFAVKTGKPRQEGGSGLPRRERAEILLKIILRSINIMKEIIRNATSPKRLMKKLIDIVVRNDLGWKILNTVFVRIADYAKSARGTRESERHEEFIKNVVNAVCPDFVVRHGPFKGMKYSKHNSFRGVLLPKLIGSYEKEIQRIIEESCCTAYSEVVDVGCAEGYYAVGFAVRIPGAKIYAYDTDPEARRLCRETAELNDACQRVVIGSFCSGETLRSIPFRGKGLIISDCEGYERILFSAAIIPDLGRHDLLIELHDSVDINTSSIIRKRFEATHEIIAIESVDDIKKAQTYNYAELDRYSLEERKLILAEGRRTIMQWFYLKSRS